MRKEKLLRVLKIGIILLLVFAISVVSLVEWKSDLIVRHVLFALQSQLQDSLTYSDVRLDAFTHFPNAAVQLRQLRTGSAQRPLLDHADVDVVVRLFPLLHDAIDIHEIQVKDADIFVQHVQGKWSYEVLKKSAKKTASKSWTAVVRQMKIDHCRVIYSDEEEQLAFQLSLNHTAFRGKIDQTGLNIDLEAVLTVDSLMAHDYQLDKGIPISLSGHYSYVPDSNIQVFKNWIIGNKHISLQVNGTLSRNQKSPGVDALVNWSDADLEEILKWLPGQIPFPVNHYSLWGKSEGQILLQGNISGPDPPQVEVTGNFKNAGIRDLSSGDELRNVYLDIHYQSADAAHQRKSSLSLHAGSSWKGDVLIVDLRHPQFDIDLEGTLPASFINVFKVPGLTVESGDLAVEQLTIHHFNPGTLPFEQWLAKGNVRFSSNHLKAVYLQNKVEWHQASIESANNEMQFQFDELTWKKAAAQHLEGKLTGDGDQMALQFKGKLCDGNVECNGTFSGIPSHPVFSADWIVNDIDIHALLESFSNFNQNFITADNLSGRANISTSVTLSMDDHWTVKPNAISCKAAIEIKDGRLKDLKTLEAFSDYVHVEDLRDIRFRDLHNYLQVENGQVFLPVMFIQSSAMNLSISGVHHFDQHILYDIKLNAGQTLVNKLRRTDFKKEFKSARKSGWINLYFVLDGTTADVHYQQNRQAVMTGFEQSAQLKESLRKELVGRFGYDVYWVEPNEWEDIPEYK